MSDIDALERKLERLIHQMDTENQGSAPPENVTYGPPIPDGIGMTAFVPSTGAESVPDHTVHNIVVKFNTDGTTAVFSHSMHGWIDDAPFDVMVQEANWPTPDRQSELPPRMTISVGGFHLGLIRVDDARREATDQAHRLREALGF